MDSFQTMRAVPDCSATGLYAFDDITPHGPFAVYETAGAHLGLGPTLKLCSRPGLPLSLEGFTLPA
jgi:hypothetical protein